MEGELSEQQETYSSYINMDGRGKASGEGKRRFSDEQIRSLESIFEEQTKLEPRKKVQVARDLGLHPRQVAIWFQNKRARWKSKNLERDYNLLRSDYDSLSLNFQSLKEERHLLLHQLQSLRRRKGKGEGSDLEIIANPESKVVEEALHQHQGQGEKPSPSASASASAEELNFSCFPDCCNTDPHWWDLWPLTE